MNVDDPLQQTNSNPTLQMVVACTKHDNSIKSRQCKVWEGPVLINFGATESVNWKSQLRQNLTVMHKWRFDLRNAGVSAKFCFLFKRIMWYTVPVPKFDRAILFYDTPTSPVDNTSMLLLSSYSAMYVFLIAMNAVAGDNNHWPNRARGKHLRWTIWVLIEQSAVTICEFEDHL